MKQKGFILIIILVLIVLTVAGYLGYKHFQSNNKSTESNSISCTLSLCDCKCHPKGETREEKEKVLCGINCAATKGVTGCEYANGKCKEIYK